MALADPQDSLARAAPMGHKDSQVGPKVGLGKVALAGYKPGYKVNLEHEGEPLERVNVKCSRAHRIDLENHTRVYHPVHNPKNKSGWDLGRMVRPRGSVVVRITDTPSERCSPT